MRESFFEVDRKLDTTAAKDEMIDMKKKFPQKQSKLMSLLSEPMSEGGPGGEINPESLEGIGCTANVILMNKKD